MDNIVKAKVIIELLDDRKYSVLSSFSSQELNKLNSIDLEVLDKLSNADINKTIGEFLSNIEKRKEKEEVIEEASKTTEPVAKSTIEKNPVKEDKKELTIAEKIQQQPPQLIACILDRVDEEKRKFVLSKLSAERKQLVENIEVESVPISDQVIGVILNELELSS